MGRVSAQLFTDNVSKDHPGNFSDLRQNTETCSVLSFLAFFEDTKLTVSLRSCHTLRLFILFFSYFVVG